MHLQLWVNDRPLKIRFCASHAEEMQYQELGHQIQAHARARRRGFGAALGKLALRSGPLQPGLLTRVSNSTLPSRPQTSISANILHFVSTTTDLRANNRFVSIQDQIFRVLAQFSPQHVDYRTCSAGLSRTKT